MFDQRNQIQNVAHMMNRKNKMLKRILRCKYAYIGMYIQSNEDDCMMTSLDTVAPSHCLAMITSRNSRQSVVVTHSY